MAEKDLMGDIPEELEPYFQDYRIHVFDIAFLADEVIESFQSDFKVVALIFKTDASVNRHWRMILNWIIRQKSPNCWRCFLGRKNILI